MTGRTAVLTTSVCALMLFACSGKIDPTATGYGSTSSSSGGASTGDSANGSDGDFVGSNPSTGTGHGPGGRDPGSNGCFMTDIGSACQRSTAVAICESKGYEVVVIRATAKGTCQATCCPPESPPTPPSPVACSYQAIGDGSTCISNADIRSNAVAICDAQSMTVRSLYPADDCPGGSTIAKLECCGK